jgi:hypothetical protein
MKNLGHGARPERAVVLPGAYLYPASDFWKGAKWKKTDFERLIQKSFMRFADATQSQLPSSERLPDGRFASMHKNRGNFGPPNV